MKKGPAHRKQKSLLFANPQKMGERREGCPRTLAVLDLGGMEVQDQGRREEKEAAVKCVEEATGKGSFHRPLGLRARAHLPGWIPTPHHPGEWLGCRLEGGGAQQCLEGHR